jgi:TolB-like protein
MSLAILPFELKGQVSMASDVIYDNIIDAFIEQDRFHIVSRGDELEAVLREQKLSQTDLVDKRTAVRVGQLVAAEGIIMGSVRETEDSIEIYARLVNTETSSILEAKDVYSQDKDLAQIQYLTSGLALKLKHSFPLIEGLVIQTKGNNIYADFGSFKRIKKEMRFIVFRQGETIVHPVTGKILGSETEQLGVATVVTVFDDMSIGKLIADFDVGNIEVKDLIITK